jgi:hypothetical protein
LYLLNHFREVLPCVTNGNHILHTRLLKLIQSEQIVQIYLLKVKCHCHLFSSYKIMV